MQMPSEIEIAIAVAGDKMEVDAATYRQDIESVVIDVRESVRTVLMVYGGRDSRMARKLIRGKFTKGYARVRGLFGTMLRDLNYRHQVHLADELGRIGGMAVTASRDDSEMMETVIAGKTGIEWLNEIFSKANHKALRSARYVIDLESADQIVTDFAFGVERTVGLFVSHVKLDNDVRIIDALTEALTGGD